MTKCGIFFMPAFLRACWGFSAEGKNAGFFQQFLSFGKNIVVLRD
jgi:hypothetical protein